jgi:proteasome lid subunit RPN8/RPN11
VSDEGPSAQVPVGMQPGKDADAWRSAAESGTARRDPARTAPAWTPASASISGALLAEIIEWSRAGAPDEACGLLASNRTAENGGTPNRFIPMRNAAASPFRYLMDPQQQLHVLLDIDDRDEVVWGIVHSHVASKAEPSATDVGLAAYPDALYLICSLAADPPVVRAWAIDQGRVGEVVLQPM